MTPIEALARASHPHNFELPTCQPDIEYALEQAAKASALLKASGFTIVSKVPSDADLERARIEISCIIHAHWSDSCEPPANEHPHTQLARSAIAAYVGGE